MVRGGEEQTQQERIDNLSDAEKASWGINPGETLAGKQKRDEKENPSQVDKSDMGPLMRRIK